MPKEHARFASFTPAVAKQLYVLEHWNWSSVAPKAMRVGLGFICIIVGLQKMLTLFFVWFISIVAYTPPGAAVAIFIATGNVRPRRRAPPGACADRLTPPRRDCWSSSRGWPACRCTLRAE